MSQDGRQASKEIAQVGTIAANNDTEIGKMIAEAMEKVGKDGVITVEEGKALETDARVRRGHAVRQGLPLAATSSPTRRRWRCVLEDAYILIHEKKISTRQGPGPAAREGRADRASRS